MIKAIFIALTILPGYVLACSCLRAPLEDHIKDADRIFVGVLSSSKIVKPKSDKEWPYVEGTIEVESTIKGKTKNKEKVLTGFGGGDCGIPMTAGRAYVIFSSTKENYIGICGASRELVRYEEKEYIEKLRGLVKKSSNK